ncbi:hypothetical protein MBLNU230_g6444t1 [Neophaeotheca triangularis]
MLCQCPPKLTPLQSRLAASLLALSLVAVFLWTLSSPTFAYAQESAIDGSGRIRDGTDHNWHRLQQAAPELELELDEDAFALTDENGTERHNKAKRQDDGDEPMAIDDNDSPNNMNAVAGETTYWVYSKDLLLATRADKPKGLPGESEDKRSIEAPDHLELRKRDKGAEGDGRLHARQNDQTVYISINTCLQPRYNGANDELRDPPPQLTLYVSNSSDNRRPGPGSDFRSRNQIERSLEGGFANVTIERSEEFYISVHAPELPDEFEGDWNYELAVSLTDYYHGFDSSEFLHLVDVDTTSALLVTNNLTEADPSDDVYKEWMDLAPPYTFFGNNNNYTKTRGLEHSYCGMRMNSQIIAGEKDDLGLMSDVELGMTSRGLGNKPKEQFYITRLNRSSTYNGILAKTGNSTASGAGVVGGGGTVWQSIPFMTKRDGNCGLLFNLSFCNEVAYAVPSNPNTFASTAALGAVYDNYAASLYQNFNYSLQQVACNASNDSKYSLAKDCTDCATAYKEWLCAVTIPRCEDFSANMDFLQPRNVGMAYLSNTSMVDETYLNEPYTPMPGAPSLDGSPAFRQTRGSVRASNSTRNAGIINAQVLPGPYKEVLPCEDLCYSLVQSCPAKLGFGCPDSGVGLEVDYGKRSDNGTVTCSYLGAVYYRNSGSSQSVSNAMVFGAAAVLGLILMI